MKWKYPITTVWQPDYWQNLPISNPKPDLQNINAHTKFGGNPLKFTQVIITIWMDGHMDNQPDNWHVAGYKKGEHQLLCFQHLSAFCLVLYTEEVNLQTFVMI